MAFDTDGIHQQEINIAQQMIYRATGRRLRIHTMDTAVENRSNKFIKGKVCFTQWHSHQQRRARNMYHSSGFGRWGRGENVAWGAGNLIAAVRMWLNSPGHYRNIKNASRDIAVARSGSFWTMVT